MPAPKVFISYSHDTPQHKKWALRLATSLRATGIDAMLDQWDLVPGQDVAAFMTNGVRSADRVVLICSESYVTKAEAGTGGVGYERLVVTAEVIEAIDTIKFIPVVRNNSGLRKVPMFLGPRLYVDFSEDDQYDEKLDDLAREILGNRAVVKPPLGENPFKGEVVEAFEPVRVASPSGATLAGQPILTDAWFQSQDDTASTGLGKIGLTGAMEVRFGLHSGLSKTQIELLGAVRGSEIRTFGWPFAVVREIRADCTPLPFGDGIRAQISIDDNGRTSYDYWAARKNGDFYAMQSLFEDQREENALFFNTRIVRVTEALMFAGKLYTALGVTPEARISARFRHRGLATRVLKSASLNRPLFENHVAHEQVSESETVIVLGDIQTKLVEEVERVCAPMFMLFNFQQFEQTVYEDIVRRFEKGETS